MANFQHIADLAFTTGSANVVLTSAEDVSSFRAGDIIFPIGQLPVKILSIASPNIILSTDALFTEVSTSAVIVAANVSLRDALVVIQENNATWARHFTPFLTWVSSTNEQENLVDNNGVNQLSYTPLGLNTLAAGITDASEAVDQLAIDVALLTTTVGDQQAALDASRDAAAISAFNASEDADKTAADVVLTTADVLSTNNAVIITTADKAATNADVILTNADVVTTDNNVVSTNDNVTSTNADVVLTAADVILTNANKVATNADVVLTGADVDQTALDVIATGDDVTEATLQKSLALDAAAIALANANYVGYWSGLVGDATVPMSMRNGDAIYMLNNYVADITLSEPDLLGTNPDFFLLGVIGATTPDSERLNGELAAYYATAQQLIDLQVAVDNSQNALTETVRRLRLNTLMGKRIYLV